MSPEPWGDRVSWLRGPACAKAENSETHRELESVRTYIESEEEAGLGLEERGRGPALEALDGPAAECQPGQWMREPLPGEGARRLDIHLSQAAFCCTAAQGTWG